MCTGSRVRAVESRPCPIDAFTIGDVNLGYRLLFFLEFAFKIDFSCFLGVEARFHFTLTWQNATAVSIHRSERDREEVYGNII